MNKNVSIIVLHALYALLYMYCSYNTFKEEQVLFLLYFQIKKRRPREETKRSHSKNEARM